MNSFSHHTKEFKHFNLNHILFVCEFSIKWKPSCLTIKQVMWVRLLHKLNKWKKKHMEKKK